MSDIEFDHFSPAIGNDPFPHYRELRETCPVAHSTTHGGFWLVTSHEHANEVTHHPETFSSRIVSVPPPPGEALVKFPPLNYDPPEHGPWKRLLTAGLRPTVATSLEGTTRSTAVQLIDSFIEAGECDAALDYAQMIPIAVVCRLLGLSAGREHEFGEWVRQTIDHGDDPEVAVAGFVALRNCVAEAVVALRHDPGDDILSNLMVADFEGRKLTDEELVLIGIELFSAGVDTTFNVLGSTIHHLATHPEQQRMLRADPSLLGTAREEFLRAFAPVMVAREVVYDVDLNDRKLRSGDLVLLALGSACRDALVFPDAEEVQLDRKSNPHLAFGSGPHRCVGSHIARMELSVALEEFLVRVPEFSLDESKPLTWSTGPIRGPRHLPVRFEPVR